MGWREEAAEAARWHLLVISGNAVHAALDENEAELGVLDTGVRGRGGGEGSGSGERGGKT